MKYCLSIIGLMTGMTLGASDTTQPVEDGRRAPLTIGQVVTLPLLAQVSVEGFLPPPDVPKAGPISYKENKNSRLSPKHEKRPTSKKGMPGRNCCR